MSNYTLVMGASTNPARYAYMAIERLVQNGKSVKAFGLKKGMVSGITIDNELLDCSGIDTVTLYLGPSNQPDYYNFIINLKPRRVIFNPGTENPEFYNLLKASGIELEVACTLVLLGTNQY